MTPYLLLILLAISAIAWITWKNRRHELILAHQVEEQTRSLREANEELERTAADLRRAQAELVDSAHRAGMAEVASDVLHNIGNALTSLQVSSTLVESKINGFRLDFLKNLGDLLASQEHRLPEFFGERRGQLVPQAINRLALKMELNRQELLDEMKVLHEQIFQINEIVISQREYAFAGKHFEMIDIRCLIDDVMCVQEAKIEEFHIILKREHHEVAPIRGAKTVLLHILNHLIRNAVEALSQAEFENRKLEIWYGPGERDNVVLTIKDNGVGIAPENLTAIFAQNWCKNQKSGNKRGNLHYCANAISGMGGALYAKSDGVGKGATFVMEIPRNPKGREKSVMDERVGYD